MTKSRIAAIAAFLMQKMQELAPNAPEVKPKDISPETAFLNLGQFDPFPLIDLGKIQRNDYKPAHQQSPLKPKPHRQNKPAHRPTRTPRGR